jgi:arylsulfatase A-like enzyme
MFAYVAYQAVHGPLEAPADAIAKFSHIQVANPTRITQAAETMLLSSLYLIRPACAKFAFNRSLTALLRCWRWQDKKRRTYAAMLYLLDEGVGNISATLVDTGMMANTVLAFSSDNGGQVNGNR